MDLTSEVILEIQRLKGVYTFMFDRCYNKSARGYHRYGGRGIAVDSSWLGEEGMKNFVLWCLQNGSGKDLQLDRTDNDAGYGPENCRWVTPKENYNNRSTTKMITAWGETKSFDQWTKDSRCLLEKGQIANRLKLGWEPEKAMTLPLVNRAPRNLTAFGETKPWPEWVGDERISVSNITLRSRVNRGWSDAQCLGLEPRVRPRVGGNDIRAWGESKKFHEWMNDDRVTLKNRKIVWQRINSYGWKPEDAFDANIKRKPKT